MAPDDFKNLGLAFEGDKNGDKKGVNENGSTSNRGSEKGN